MDNILISSRPGFYRTKIENSANQIFDLFDGEESIYKQYLKMFKNAKSFIYIENQHICDESLMELLLEALKRFVLRVLSSFFAKALARARFRSDSCRFGTAVV